jgi:hypothetical protein
MGYRSRAGRRRAGAVAAASVLALLLASCSSAPRDLTPEPTQSEKAWHNCIEVLSASPVPRTDEDITAEIICTNQRATWKDFDSKWIVELDRLVDMYKVDLGDVSLYRS